MPACPVFLRPVKSIVNQVALILQAQIDGGGGSRRRLSLFRVVVQ